MVRNNKSRNNMGTSWDAYNQPSSNNNNRTFNNNNRVNRPPNMNHQRNNNEQDAVGWDQYDKEHGASHPNKCSFSSK